MHGSVFTHGDIRTGNIMMNQDPDFSSQYVVTGKIVASTPHTTNVLTHTLSLVDQNSIKVSCVLD